MTTTYPKPGRLSKQRQIERLSTPKAMKATPQQRANLAARTGASKQSKLRNTWTKCSAGHNHQSKKEANRCEELRLLAKGGEIEALTYQPRFKLVVNGELITTYIADFAYRDARTLVEVTEDVKGWKRGNAYELFKVKAKLLHALYGITVSET